MKSRARTVSKSAVPLASCVREWDGATVDFYVVKRRRRSHDPVVDGTVQHVPTAAVAGTVIWTGEALDDEQAAKDAAGTACAEVRAGRRG